MAAASCPRIPRGKKGQEDMWALGMRMISDKEAYIRKAIGVSLGVLFLLMFTAAASFEALGVPVNTRDWEYQARSFAMSVLAGGSVTLYQMGVYSQ